MTSPAPASSPGPTRSLPIPHVHVIIFGLLLLTALSSLLLPAGAYERDERGRVVPGTYAPLDAEALAERPEGWGLVFAIFEAPLKGIQAASSVIAFILVIGGAFEMMNRTGAFETAIRSTLARLGGARWAVVPVAMLLFSIGGAVFGMGEEIIPFVLLLVPMVRALGLPPIFAVAIPLVGSQIGFAGAMINPFTVGVAQGIAELPPFSGWEYRTLVWVLVTTLGIVYVARSARLLPAAETAEGAAEGVDDGDGDNGTGLDADAARPSASQVAVLATLVLGILLILWGVYRFEWYVTEIGAVFMAVGVVSAIVGRLRPNDAAEAFVAGARDLVGAALVVGVARGIVVLAQDLGVLDTLLHGVAGALGGLPGAVALNLMFAFQTVLNFFIPSGSGQAALTMPIMAPLAELVGLTRQMAVLAFQLGDGFSNLIVPTSAVLMGSLEAGKVRYEDWFAYAWRLQLWLMAFGVVVLVGAVAIGYGP